MTIKISELPLTNSIAGGDYFVLVRDPLGVPVTSKLYASKLSEGLISVSFANVAANVIPSTDSVYSLGNIDFQWNSLYVSNQVVLGGYPLTVTDGILSINGTSQSLTVRSTAGNNGAVNVAVSTVRTINFDDSTGLHITDQGNGAVFVELGSGFKYINVANQNSIVAVGEDSLTIANGQGISLSTSNTSPKTLTISGVAGVSGSNTEIQFNENGALGANQNFRFIANSTTASVKLGGTKDGHLEFTSNTGNRVGEIFVYDEGLNINSNSDIKLSVGASQTELITLSSNGAVKLSNTSYLLVQNTHGVPGQVLTSNGSAGLYWANAASGGGGGSGNAYNIVSNNTALIALGPYSEDYWGTFYGYSTDAGDAPTSSVRFDNNGNIIQVGVAYDSGYSNGSAIISKLDPNGNFLWSKALDGSETVAESVRVDGNNNIYVIVNDYNNSGYYITPSHCYVVKFDPNGNVLWTSDLSGYPNSSGYWGNTLFDLELNSNNQVIVVGGGTSTAVSLDATDGSLQWQWSGAYYAAGYIVAIHQNKILIGSYDSSVIILNFDGTLDKVVKVFSTYNDIYGIDSDGTDWYVVSSGADIAKISGADNETTLWQISQPSFNWDYPTYIRYSSGHVYIPIISWDDRLTIVKLNANTGAIEWINYLSDNGSYYLGQWYWYGHTDLDVRGSDIVIVGSGGEIKGSLQNNYYGMTFKIPTDGSLTNPEPYGNFFYTTNPQDTFISNTITNSGLIAETSNNSLIVITSNNNVISNSNFTAPLSTYINDRDFFLLGYSQWSFSNTGVMEWPDGSKSYSGNKIIDSVEATVTVGNGHPEVWGQLFGILDGNGWSAPLNTVTIDSTGNIIAGSDQESYLNGNWQTGTYFNTGVISKLKSDGTLLWSKRVQPVGNENLDYSNMAVVAVDTNDNIYSVNFFDIWPNPYYTLTKMDSNGNIIWSKDTPYNGKPQNLCIDNQSGNIYVSGYDGLVAHDSTGTVIWGKKWSAPWPGSWPVAAAAGNNQLIVATREGIVHIFDPLGVEKTSPLSLTGAFGTRIYAIVYNPISSFFYIMSDKATGSPTGTYFTVTKFNASNYSLVWSKGYGHTYTGMNGGGFPIYMDYEKTFDAWAANYNAKIVVGTLFRGYPTLNDIGWMTFSIFPDDGRIYPGYQNVRKIGMNPDKATQDTWWIGYHTTLAVGSYNNGIYGAGVAVGGAGEKYNGVWSDSWDNGVLMHYAPYTNAYSNVTFDVWKYNSIPDDKVLVANSNTAVWGNQTNGYNFTSNTYLESNSTSVFETEPLYSRETTHMGGPYTYTFAGNTGSIVFPDGTSMKTASGSGLSSIIASNNQTVVYSNGLWNSTDFKVSGLADVNATSFVSNTSANNFYLKWNNALQKWQANAAVSTMVTLTDVNITANSSIDGYMVIWDNASSKFIARNPFNNAYDISGFVSQTYSSNETVASFVASRNITWPANMSTSYARAATASTSSVVFSIKRNGTQIATMTFNSSNTATFATSSGTSKSITAGDMIAVVAPSSVDTNITDIAFTFAGTLT